jgi:4'-phosphopantetheinyl transferase
LLGKYLNLSSAELRFQYSPYGKPSLDNVSPGERLRFNLSHSHERALVAFTRAGKMGVDLEFMRADFDFHEVAERWFSAREVEMFSALPASLRTEAFFNCWTRKEAYVKARGEGLSHPLKSFSVSLAPDEAARFLSIEGDAMHYSRWSLQNLQVAEGYAAALAVENTHCETFLWEAEPEALAA